MEDLDKNHWHLMATYLSWQQEKGHWFVLSMTNALFIPILFLGGWSHKCSLAEISQCIYYGFWIYWWSIKLCLWRSGRGQTTIRDTPRGIFYEWPSSTPSSYIKQLTFLNECTLMPQGFSCLTMLLLTVKQWKIPWILFRWMLVLEGSNWEWGTQCGVKFRVWLIMRVFPKEWKLSCEREE